MSFLVIIEILAHLSNTFNAHGKYSFRNNFRNQLKCDYLRNKIFFLIFLLHFGNVYQILNNLNKKMNLIAYVNLKLQTANDVVR